MILPSFTFFNLFSTMVFVLSLFAILKILTLDWKLHFKEGVYFLAAALVTSVISVVNRDLSVVFSHTFGDFSMLLAMFLYFRKLKCYNVKKSVILTFIASYINITMLFLSMVIFYYSFSNFDVRFNPDFIPDMAGGMPLLETLQVLSYFPFFVIPTFLLVKVTGRVRQLINENERLQTLFMIMGIVILASFHIIMTIFRYLEYANWLISENTLVFIFVAFALLLGFSVYVGYINARHERRQAENEQKSLLYYTEALERQQIAVQKFKHDYQNILLSMRGYIEEKDLAGLEAYYSSKVEAVSEIITKDQFALQSLYKIKVREIKSILTAKLMMAQNMDLDIQTTFEANEDIDSIPIDSVVLVRMLGIILDNAIEALTELGGGTLFVGCYKWEAGITFIVQNTCPPDTPPLHALLQPGFSTKGEGRGLGLSNLSEFVNAHPSLTLGTSVQDGVFIQRLFIGNETGNGEGGKA